jgi:hypothetical protein
MHYPNNIVLIFQLIPDLREYKEAYIDFQLAWLSGSYTNIDSEEAMRWEYEGKYFQDRLLELDTDYTLAREAIYRQYQADLEKIQNTKRPIESRGVPAHVHTNQELSWVANQQVRRREQYEADLELLEKQYISLKQQCVAKLDQIKASKEKLPQIN